MSISSTRNENKTSLLGETSFTKYNALNESVTENETNDTTTVRRKNKDAHTVLELKPIGGNRSSEPSAYDENTVLLHEEIQDGDTLQSLSLRYGCTVNEIKRTNGLITEQDFYARKKIKIPVNRYSLLTIPEEKQRHQEEHEKFFSVAPLRNSIATLSNGATARTVETTLPSHNHSSIENDDNTPSDFGSSESLEDAPLLSLSHGGERSPSLDANKYLKKLDKDIRKTVRKADLKNDQLQTNESLNEVLSSIQYYPVNPIAPNVKQRRHSNGADCGMQWWSLILCFFIVLGVIIALAIFEWYHSN